MTHKTEYSRQERFWLWGLSIFGFFAANTAFMYGVLFQSDADKNMTIVKCISKMFVLSIVLTALPYQIAYSDPVSPVIPEKMQGVSVIPLDNHPVPDLLKDQARSEISQMKGQGYVDADESAVSYLDAAKGDKKRLRPMSEVAPTLKILPANIVNSKLSQATLLGAIASGGYTDEGWTGINRIFVVPKLGLIGLEEVDYVASGGGFAMIKEAINQDVNGNPAILRIKQSQSQKSLSELTWTTDRKIYTLSVNRALKTQQAIEEFLSLARTISD